MLLVTGPGCRFGMGGDHTQGTTVVVVTHGLTLRVFLMRWYKWTVEMFEKVHNPGNSKILVMDKGAGGRYSLAVYHSRKELLQMGLTERMIDDQVWQSSALPGDFNSAWPTSGAGRLLLSPLLFPFQPHLSLGSIDPKAAADDGGGRSDDVMAADDDMGSRKASSAIALDDVHIRYI